ncbi:MAG: alpha/beta fold hydrolase [Chitinophagaceae bacterium]
MKKACVAIAILFAQFSFAQSKLDKLTVEKIMRDPKWIGTSPSGLQWTVDGKYLFFKWNPDKAAADSSYYITAENKTPQKASVEMLQRMVFAEMVAYNRDGSAYVYSKYGDIFLVSMKDRSTRRVTQTVDAETNPQFSFNDTKIVYRKDLNLFTWDPETGLTSQLTNFKKGPTPKEEKKESTTVQEKWLAADVLGDMEVLAQRKAKLDTTESINKKNKPKELRSIYTDDRMIQGITLDPAGRFVTYRLNKIALGSKSTIIPNYITETGFTTDISGRTKVGEISDASESYVFDIEKDTVVAIKTDGLPGIKDQPDFVKDYPVKDTAKQKKPVARPVTISTITWNEKGTQAFADIFSQDNKDRWIMLLDAATAKLTPVDRQRDESWIGGPGISSFRGSKGWINANTIWFQSEASGYSHIYTYNTTTKTKKQLTAGNFEVQTALLSKDKKYFYITTNEVHPGEQQYYRMSVDGGRRERITTLTGANQVTVSPDEKQFGFLYSYSNKPWELYLQPNQPGTEAQEVTFKAETDEFKSYPWRDPLVMSFKASDGATVYARLYKPTNPDPKKPAVFFVHGAGYLQNAHKWWSSYFREYMFNNLLTDLGYTVMDIDYRGSAGYGRNWRTGIYRWMGGKDLDDQVDAAKWLVDSLGIDKNRIGMYGGSYGGFMTLMAMFTKPELIKAGAALRPVTDWAHYNHGYTSNILNEPFTDSLSYRRSSPIYFANGLKNHLLICHGMVDLNVHFQDAVRLTQRLIELGKDNWELAPYPMEDHGFVEPSSWTDEYKRILKLFEMNLK